MFRVSLLALLIFVPASIVASQEPQKQPQPEKLPAPKLVQPPPIVIEPYAVRSGSRDVWQHYGVNSLGRFVPRVISTPYGYHYSRDLEPYPWAMNRSTAIRP
jgi:hypothetical protein